ncbi:MAG TPA: sigma-70 family RNA polymerase sigma factor [Polyangia bacterium]|jgi:RNA polymerase sigma-70 factor (ECF subfamily)
MASEARGPPTLASLYRDHLDFVRRIARRLGGPGLDPEDIAQEVFEVVANKISQFEPDLAQPTTWLFSITFNVVRVHRRRSRLRATYRADERLGWDVHAESVDPSSLIDATGIMAEILAEMPPKKRAVYVLGELHGLTCSEIAEVVGAKEETVWSRLHYARLDFEARLKRYRRLWEAD